MSVRFVWAVAATAVFTGAVRADPPTEGEVKKSVPRPNEVEVRLSEGSVLRMIVLQEALEVQTAFGKLTVPTKQIRKIDFGLRLPEDTVRKIEAAIKKLSSDNFDQREQAAAELIAIGPEAVPALRDAGESSDPEIVQRARSAMKKIREKAGAGAKIPTTTSDKIETVLFTIVGQVVSPTILAEGYFGKAELKVADLRGVRWMSANTEVEVTVDASKHSANNNQWLATDILIEGDAAVLITASGQVDLNPDGGGNFMTGPQGNRNWGGGRGPHAPGALLGRVGEKGQVFLIGEKFKGAPGIEGKLYLQIAGSPWNQSQGTYKVKVLTGRNLGED
jgi:hypothetical protein